MIYIQMLKRESDPLLNTFKQGQAHHAQEGCDPALATNTTAAQIIRQKPRLQKLRCNWTPLSRHTAENTMGSTAGQERISKKLDGPQTKGPKNDT